jgi:hypothetical protein
VTWTEEEKPSQSGIYSAFKFRRRLCREAISDANFAGELQECAMN